MQAIDTIKHKLAAINDKDYGAYQSLKGTYQYNSFSLTIQQIPKDPYAPPHTGIYRISFRRDDERYIQFTPANPVQRVAFEDYLTRRFYQASRDFSKGLRGTGNSGLITINQPGQTVLKRNCVLVKDDVVEVRCFVGLPGNGRKVVSKIAETMLLEELPAIVEQAFYQRNTDIHALQRHIDVIEDAETLRDQLSAQGLIAFIANNAILPRESGTSDRPKQGDNVLPFVAPPEMTVTFDLPHKGEISGMGIKSGITLIVGGGYHGKSTLLSVLEAGIYNHIPGDGREYCVSLSETVKLRAYSGRRVSKTDISSFINNLPFQQDTSAFSSENASGSTSQAANIIEAMEVGTKVILMDEDTCATNFMIRDRKMQQLVSKDKEPITAFIDKVKQLYQENGVSTILVLGGVGDYFDVSDHVIQMIDYEPKDVTSQAHQIAAQSPVGREQEGDVQAIRFRQRIPLSESVSALNAHAKFAIYAKEVNRLNFGEHVIDLSDVEQLVELSQTKALGFALEYAKKYMTEGATLCEVVEQTCADIDQFGLDILSDRVSGHFAAFRSQELAFCLNRLRGFDVIQKKG